jgi:hypothetical protein
MTMSLCGRLVWLGLCLSNCVHWPSLQCHASFVDVSLIAVEDSITVVDPIVILGILLCSWARPRADFMEENGGK